MANILTAYAASSALTITLASLATSSTRTAGAESNAVDNTSNLYLDYLLAGKVTTGTTPTSGKVIEVCVVGIADDTTWPDVFDGTASAETVLTADVKNAICRTVATMQVDGTSNQTYWFGPVSVANAFGGTLPKKWVAFVAHDTAVNLNSTGGNHAIFVTGVYNTA